MVTSLTICPVAVVPDPPAVRVIAPSVAIVPAKSPVYPPAVVVVLPKAGRSVTLPHALCAAGVPLLSAAVYVNAETSLPAPIVLVASPKVKLSVRLNASQLW